MELGWLAEWETKGRAMGVLRGVVVFGNVVRFIQCINVWYVSECYIVLRAHTSGTGRGGAGAKREQTTCGAVRVCVCVCLAWLGGWGKWGLFSIEVPYEKNGVSTDTIR